MPITNGKYVAPTWSNGGGTPLSAANLQDISDALAFSGRIVSGSYSGTGTYSNVSLTFPFPPKLVIIKDRILGLMIIFLNLTSSYNYYVNTGYPQKRYIALTSGGSPTSETYLLTSCGNVRGRLMNNVLQWSYNSGKTQAGDEAYIAQNASGSNYDYVAIG